ncbi:FAR1-related protein [Sesbania bispinosa]|nr:FAR1-related protein [Sesbania bispinosa]
MEKSGFVSSIKSVDDKDPSFNLCSNDSDIGEEGEFFYNDEKEDIVVAHDQPSRLIDLSGDEIMSLEFGSEEEAYNFYQLYAQFHGFVVRKDDVTKDIRDFKRAMYSNFTPDEFEEFWKEKVVEHGLVGNKWVTKMSYCKRKSSMVEFLHKFEQAKKEYKNNEMMAEFRSLFFELVLTTYLRSIEKEASKMYTQEIFKEFKQEIEKANALIVCERLVLEENVMFTLKKSCIPGDPNSVKTKGAPKKKKDNRKRRRRCSNCVSTGHTIRRCPLRYGTDQDSKRDEKLEKSESGANDSEEAVMDTAEENVEQSYTNEAKGGESNDQQLKGQQSNVSFDCTRQNVNKAKDKCKNKEKTSREPKHSNEPEIKLGGCSVGVKPANCEVPSMVSPIVPPMHFPINGYGSCSQGYPIHPNFSGGPIPNPNIGVPMYGQNPQFPFYQQHSQFPIYPQAPRFYPGLWNQPNNGTSMNALLHEVMKTGGQTKQEARNNEDGIGGCMSYRGMNKN